jgi:pimeloyl-ACP methyl ester carboxylesterase
MPTKSIYRSPEGEAEIHAIYDRQLARLKLPCESLMVNTLFGNTHVLAFGPQVFGNTHVLAFGPQAAPPVVVLQGGNTTSPITLSWLRTLIDKYRVYAPDTIGHPGKSAPVRLSPRNDSYGQWLVEVLDTLGLKQPPLLGGSYGAGILLRAAVYAPERISKAVLFIPSGLVSIPISTMLYLLVWLGLYRLAPTRSRLKRILWPMFKDEPIDEEVLEITEAVFRHVHIESEMPRNVRREELIRFKAPTLVMAAEKDGLFPAEKVVKRAHEVFPNLVAAEVIPGATHYLPAHCHAYLNEHCERFLKDTDL